MYTHFKNIKIHNLTNVESELRELVEPRYVPFDELLSNITKLYRSGRLDNDEYKAVIEYLASIEVEKQVSCKLNKALHDRFWYPHFHDFVSI